MLGFSDLDILPSFTDKVGGQRVDIFVMVYDQSGLSDGPLRFKQILSRIRSEVRNYPRYRQLLRPSALSFGDSRWLEDEAFDVEFHVRHIALPKPGDWRQFSIQVARLHSRPLDQTHPLWEINVIEGLDNIPGLGEGHFALVCKVHRALMDSTHEGDLAWTLHDEMGFVADDAHHADSSILAPGLAMLRAGCDSLLRPLGGPLELAIKKSRKFSSGLMPGINFYANALLGQRSVPYTRFNTDVSSFRVWESCSFSREKVDTLQERYPGVSESDLMAAMVGGALRRYLSEKTELGGRNLWTLAPTQQQLSGEPDSQPLAFSVVDLATRIDDPVERLLSISRLRRQEQPIGKMVQDKHLRSPLRRMAQTNDLLHRIQGEKGAGGLANTALISLPDEKRSLRLLGAPLVYFSGVPEIINGLGLVHLVSCYDERLTLTFTSCREMLPDPAYYRDCLYQSLQELLDAVPQEKQEME